jgi:hypothetical protein
MGEVCREAAEFSSLITVADGLRKTKPRKL